MGTLNYMAPEQGLENKCDVRSDLYSMGVVLYEMLTQQKPFLGDTAMGLIYQHSNAPVPLLPEHLAKYQALLNLMLAKAPADRLQSVEEIEEWF